MQPDSQKLIWDMQEAVERIVRFTASADLNRYQSDDLLRSAVERQFEIIGEALSRLMKLDSGTAQRISEHRRIIAFRNVLIHGYDVITDAVTWDIIQNKLPVLKRELDGLASGS